MKNRRAATCNLRETYTIAPVDTALPVGEGTPWRTQYPPAASSKALKVLWVRGNATVREIFEEMRPAPWRGELAYTTVLSLLQTMEQKGLVGHESAGKAYLYFPLAQRDTTFRSLAGSFLDQVFDGALGEYVAGPPVQAAFAGRVGADRDDDRRGEEEVSATRRAEGRRETMSGDPVNLVLPWLADVYLESALLLGAVLVGAWHFFASRHGG